MPFLAQSGCQLCRPAQLRIDTFADDESLCRAVNLVIANEGGVSCVIEKNEMVVPLPVAGLMSANDGFKVAEDYTAIDQMAKKAGSTLGAPFMTLSFMALLVIPSLKLSDNIMRIVCNR